MPDTPHHSFARVARRSAALATNVLAIGLVLVLGLSLGRATLGWWHAEEPTVGPPDAATTPGVDLGAPLMVHIGDSSQPLEVRRVTGNVAEMKRALRAFGNEAIADAPPECAACEEPQSFDPATLPPPIAATRHGELYEMPGELPMVVAYAPAKANDMQQRRLLFCALALPAADSQWTLYGIRPGEAAASKSDLPLPLPPGAQRVMSLSQGAEAGTAVFSTHEPLEDMMEHYRRWIAKNDGWQTTQDWERVGYAWHATYVHRDRRQQVEIHVGLASGGHYQGVMTFAPLSTTK